MKKGLLLIPFAAILIGVFYFTQAKSPNSTGPTEAPIIEPAKPVDVVKQIEISDGQVYGQVMAAASIDPEVAQKIYDSAKPVYDLAKIRAGKKIVMVYAPDGQQLKKVVYKINSEDELIVDPQDKWKAEVKPIPYEVKIKNVKGEVKTSMYAAALENGIDERAIIDLADAFQWTIDFATDPKVGDTFSMVYEERYLDGAYAMPGRILAGRYVNEGEKSEVYYFKESADNEGYFDKDGNSVQKMFLKAPVQFRYISSGFTNGLRYVSAFSESTHHRAIDYAAALGTPIRAVGDGTVTFAGWSTAGYGNLTSIRHNGTYSTNYAHQSKIIVKRGQKVKQGQVIGYVGSTGYSTGPHLHFEMVKNGIKINPLKEILPPGKALEEQAKSEFLEMAKRYESSL